MKRKINMLILLVLIMSTFTGCWDKIELESRGFAISIGVDKLEKDKTSNDISVYPNRYSVTLALPKLSNFSSKGSGGEESKIIKKIKAVTVPGGMITANDNTSQSLNYSHSKIIVFGSELLKDEKLFKEALDGLERIHDINRKVIITATDGKAEEVLSAKSGNEPLVGLFVSSFYDNNTNTAATTFREDLEDLLKQLRWNGCALIPKISVKDDQVSLEGACIIKDYVLLDWLTPEETSSCLFISEKASGMELLTLYKDVLLKCRVLKQNTKLSFSENNNKLKMTIDIKIDGEIEEYILSDKELFDSKLLKEFGHLYEKELKKNLEKTYKKIQKEYKVDFFHIDQALSKVDYELWQKYSDNWQKNYEAMEIEVSANVDIKSLGITK